MYSQLHRAIFLLLAHFAAFSSSSQLIISGHWVDERRIDYDDVAFTSRIGMASDELTISCPVETHAYDCFRNNKTRATILRNRNFRPLPNSPLSLFAPFEFIRAYQNKTVVFFGDSVTQQIFQSFVCQLLVATPAKMALSWSGIHKSCTLPTGCQGSLVFGDVFFPAANLRFLFHLLNWGLYQHNLKSFPSSPDIVFVLNFGIHYNVYAGKPTRDYDASDLRTHMLDLKSDIELFHKTSQVFILESTPQHFSGSNVNGYWSNDFALEHCIPLNISTMRAGDWRNLIINETRFPANVKIVRIAEVLYSQWDAHFSEKDCTHWCKFGGALEYIQTSIFNSFME